MLLSQLTRLIKLCLIPGIAFANIGEVSDINGVPAQIERLSGTQLEAGLQTNI